MFLDRCGFNQLIVRCLLLDLVARRPHELKLPTELLYASCACADTGRLEDFRRHFQAVVQTQVRRENPCVLSPSKCIVEEVSVGCHRSSIAAVTGGNDARCPNDGRRQLDIDDYGDVPTTTTAFTSTTTIDTSSGGTSTATVPRRRALVRVGGKRRFNGGSKNGGGRLEPRSKSTTTAASTDGLVGQSSADRITIVDGHVSGQTGRRRRRQQLVAVTPFIRLPIPDDDDGEVRVDDLPNNTRQRRRAGQPDNTMSRQWSRGESGSASEGRRSRLRRGSVRSIGLPYVVPIQFHLSTRLPDTDGDWPDEFHTATARLYAMFDAVENRFVAGGFDVTMQIGGVGVVNSSSGHQSSEVGIVAPVADSLTSAHVLAACELGFQFNDTVLLCGQLLVY